MSEVGGRHGAPSCPICGGAVVRYTYDCIYYNLRLNHDETCPIHLILDGAPSQPWEPSSLVGSAGCVELNLTQAAMELSRLAKEARVEGETEENANDQA